MLQHRPLPLLLAWLAYSLPLVALALGMTLTLEINVWWSWVLLLLVAPLFSLPLVATCGHLVFSPTVDLNAIFRNTLRRTLPFLLLLTLLRVMVILGFLALIVPGLYLWRGSWFLGPIVALEGTSLGSSLRRARHFAAGFQGLATLHAFNGATLLIYLTTALAAVGHFMVGILGLNMAVIGDLTRHDLYEHLLAMIAFALSAPFVTTIWFFVYLEVRTRKEGWDLEIAFRDKARQLESRRG